MTASRATVSADATARSVRTLLQGLAFDLPVVVVAGLLQLLTEAPAELSWSLVGLTVAKSAGTAALAYWMRLRAVLPATLDPAADVAEDTVAALLRRHGVDLERYGVQPQKPGEADHSAR